MQLNHHTKLQKPVTKYFLLIQFTAANNYKNLLKMPRETGWEKQSLTNNGANKYRTVIRN